MKIVRRDEGRVSRRKNLAGITYEIAAHPEGASYEDFIWRMSRAEIDDNAALLAFPGVDRTLVLVEGRGVALDFGDGTVILGADSGPLSFPGEAPVVAWLNAGKVCEFNVMTRRGEATHWMRAFDVPGRPLPEGCSAVMCRHGTVTLAGETLEPGDCALLAPGECAEVPGGAGRIIAVGIEIMDPPDTSARNLIRLRSAFPVPPANIDGGGQG